MIHKSLLVERSNLMKFLISYLNHPHYFEVAAGKRLLILQSLTESDWGLSALFLDY